MAIKDEEVLDPAGSDNVPKRCQRVAVTKLHPPAFLDFRYIVGKLFLVVGNAIGGKNVDPDPAAVILPDRKNGCAPRFHRVIHTAVVEIVVRVFLAYYTEPRCGESRHEPFIIRTRHDDVYIVVPGDESFVPDSPDEGAISEGILNLVLKILQKHQLSRKLKMH